jgi:hypothetical protein
VSPYREAAQPSAPPASRQRLVVSAITGAIGALTGFIISPLVGPAEPTRAQDAGVLITHTGGQEEAEVWAAAYAGCIASTHCSDEAGTADQAVREWRERAR